MGLCQSAVRRSLARQMAAARRLGPEAELNIIRTDEIRLGAEQLGLPLPRGVEIPGVISDGGQAANYVGDACEDKADSGHFLS